MLGGLVKESFVPSSRRRGLGRVGGEGRTCSANERSVVRDSREKDGAYSRLRRGLHASTLAATAHNWDGVPR